MSKFLRLTDKVVEDLINGGARITSLEAHGAWDVKETTKQIMEQMEE